MASVNKVILVGNLGADPEVRYLPSGDAVANIRLATTDRYKDKTSGEMKEAHGMASRFVLRPAGGDRERISEEGLVGVYRRAASAPASGRIRTARKGIRPKSSPSRCRCWAAAAARCGGGGDEGGYSRVRRRSVAAAVVVPAGGAQRGGGVAWR